MRYLTMFILFCLSVGMVSAENLFQYNNPFPQTSPQAMNNIYESEPAVMQKENEKEKEVKKSFWNRNKKRAEKETTDILQPNVYPLKNEGIQDGSFYIFK